VEQKEWRSWREFFLNEVWWIIDRVVIVVVVIIAVVSAVGEVCWRFLLKPIFWLLGQIWTIIALMTIVNFWELGRKLTKLVRQVYEAIVLIALLARADELDKVRWED